MESTEREKLNCALLLAQIMGLEGIAAKDLIEKMDEAYLQKNGTAQSGKEENGEGKEEEKVGDGEDMEDDEMEDVSAG